MLYCSTVFLMNESMHRTDVCIEDGDIRELGTGLIDNICNSSGLKPTEESQCVMNVPQLT